MSKTLHVKNSVFFSDFNETLLFSKDFPKKTLKYQVSSKSVHWEPSCSMRTDGHDEANIRFCNFANAPNKLYNIARTKLYHTVHPMIIHSLL